MWNSKIRPAISRVIFVLGVAIGLPSVLCLGLAIYKKSSNKIEPPPANDGRRLYGTGLKLAGSPNDDLSQLHIFCRDQFDATVPYVTGKSIEYWDGTVWPLDSQDVEFLAQEPLPPRWSLASRSDYPILMFRNPAGHIIKVRRCRDGSPVAQEPHSP